MGRRFYGKETMRGTEGGIWREAASSLRAHPDCLSLLGSVDLGVCRFVLLLLLLSSFLLRLDLRAATAAMLEPNMRM